MYFLPKPHGIELLDNNIDSSNFANNFSSPRLVMLRGATINKYITNEIKLKPNYNP